MSAATPTEEQPNSPDESPDEITLYVNNLPHNDCTQEEVQKLFEKFGKVVNVTHRHNTKNGSFSGNSFVTFARKEDGEKAIQELNGTEYKGLTLVVQQAKRPYQRDYKRPNEQRRFRDDYDRSPRFVRYRDDRLDRQYAPRYSGGRGYYNPDPYYNDYYPDYDRKPRYSSGYRDYQDYDRRPPRYRRDDVYDSRQSRRSPTNYPRHQRSEEYD